jgi:lipopolysaccharide/colanic/teichoic acid biosynthesis glycosyltransferase
MARGASARRDHTASAMKIMLVPAIVAWVLQVATYCLFIARAGRSDWANALVVLASLLVLTLIAAFSLTTLKRQESPLSTATIVGFFAFVFGVAGLSALRVPVSYVALAACAPVFCGGLAVANYLLQRANRHRVGLLEFEGASDISKQFPFLLPLIAVETPDIKAYDKVLIDTAAHHASEYSSTVARLYMSGLEVVPWPYHLERVTGRVDINEFNVSDLIFRPDQIYYAFIKRTIDVVSVVALLPLVLPLAALIWAYIRLLDGGPSLFIQERRGFAGGNFRMYKFRTMRKGTEAGATQADDDRILPGCKILRQLRLDELPQLFNILKGDMSWIGPRPVSLEIAEALEQRLPQYVNRQLVPPGLSGWAQVKLGYTSDLDQEVTKLSFDLYYIKHMSFDLDLLILVKTVRTILMRAGAR